jgi:hypothetical protein
MITRHGDASYTLVCSQYYDGISFVNELLNGNLLSGYRVFYCVVKLMKTLKILMDLLSKRFAQC